MQLYSKEKNVSQPIEGHAAAFHSYTCEGATSPSTLFTFAAKGAAGAKVGFFRIQYLHPSHPFSAAIPSHRFVNPFACHAPDRRRM